MIGLFHWAFWRFRGMGLDEHSSGEDLMVDGVTMVRERGQWSGWRPESDR